VAKREHEMPDTQFDVTPTELRAADLPLQPFGGYSRPDTNQLLDRAAGTLEEKTSSLQKQISELRMALDEARQRLADEASREPASVEHAVGEVLVTAHRAAEVLRNEANEEVDRWLMDAREHARKIVAEAERRLEEIDAAKIRAEVALAQTQAETQSVREDAERAVAELHAEARRVYLVIDEFRNQWWNLISEALKQLELRVPSADAPAEQTEILQDDLRRRLGETQGEEGIHPEGTGDSEIESHGKIGSS
jgi:cell division septum initiation protein DivIVA